MSSDLRHDHIPPYGLRAVPPPETEITPHSIAGVTLILLVLLLLIGLYLRWHRRTTPPTKTTPEDPWHVLERDVSLWHLDSLSCEQAASAISMAVRRLIELCTGFPCVDWTSDEFERYRAGLPPIEGVSYDEVALLLAELDVVRYGARPVDTEAQMHWHQLFQKYWQLGRAHQQRLAGSEVKSSVEVVASPSPSSQGSSRGGLRVFD